MPSGYIGAAAAAGGGSATDYYPSSPLSDQVNVGASTRTAAVATASGTPHADGAYTELDASLSADAAGMWVYVHAITAAVNADSSTLIEFATGAAASEVAWATIGWGYRPAFSTLFVPGHIAAGTRTAFRVRSAVASQAVTIHVSYLTPKDVAPGAPVTIGANTGTSRGISIAGTSVNTKSAWVQLTASTSAAFTQLMVCPQGDGDSTMAGGSALIDIGIGAAAAEAVLIGDIEIGQLATEQIVPRSPLTYGVSIPAGSRLSARWARDSTSNSLDIILVGA